MNKQELAGAAVDYSRRGWSVIPIGSDKKPIGSWKLAQQQRHAPTSIADEYGAMKNLQGVGIVLGEVSDDLYVRDFDTAVAYERWARAHPDLARSLPTAQTARGYHVYARWKGVRTRTFEDGELRGQGAYVIAPPSIHSSGVRYRWLSPPADVIPQLDPEQAGFAGDPAADATDDTDANDATHATEATYDLDVIRSTDMDPGPLAAFINASKPGCGTHDRCLFSFVRMLKSLPELKDGSVLSIKPYVCAWWKTHRATIHGDDSWTFTWGKASRGWKTAKTAFGDTIASAVAEAAGLPMPRCVAEYSDDDNAIKLAKLCVVLARRSERGEFMLSFRTIETYLKIPKASAHAIMEAFKSDGIVRLIRRGKKEPGGKRSASVWRMIGDCK